MDWSMSSCVCPTGTNPTWTTWKYPSIRKTQGMTLNKCYFSLFCSCLVAWTKLKEACLTLRTCCLPDAVPLWYYSPLFYVPPLQWIDEVRFDVNPLAAQQILPFSVYQLCRDFMAIHWCSYGCPELFTLITFRKALYMVYLYLLYVLFQNRHELCWGMGIFDCIQNGVLIYEVLVYVTLSEIWYMILQQIWHLVTSGFSQSLQWWYNGVTSIGWTVTWRFLRIKVTWQINISFFRHCRQQYFFVKNIG